MISSKDFQLLIEKFDEISKILENKEKSRKNEPGNAQNGLTFQEAMEKAISSLREIRLKTLKLKRLQSQN